jgi:magnesium-transporting ATPase (P-type)
MAYYEA